MAERANERLPEEQAACEGKLAARQAKEQSTGKKPTGKASEPPKDEPHDKDPYHCTTLQADCGFSACWSCLEMLESGHEDPHVSVVRVLGRGRRRSSRGFQCPRLTGAGYEIGGYLLGC